MLGVNTKFKVLKLEHQTAYYEFPRAGILLSFDAYEYNNIAIEVSRYLHTILKYIPTIFRCLSKGAYLQSKGTKGTYFSLHSNIILQHFY